MTQSNPGFPFHYLHTQPCEARSCACRPEQIIKFGENAQIGMQMAGCLHLDASCVNSFGSFIPGPPLPPLTYNCLTAPPPAPHLYLPQHQVFDLPRKLQQTLRGAGGVAAFEIINDASNVSLSLSWNTVGFAPKHNYLPQLSRIVMQTKLSPLNIRAAGQN